MVATHFLALILMVAAAPVELQWTSGERTQSDFHRVAAGEIELSAAGELQRVPVTEISRLNFSNPAAVDPRKRSTQVTLIDGTSILCKHITSDGQTASLMLTSGIVIETPNNLLASVRLSELTPEQHEKWGELCDSENSQLSADIVVLLRPGNALESIEGVVLKITEEAVSFDFGGQTIDIPLEKLAGLRTFTTQKPLDTKVIAEIQDIAGNRWFATGLGSSDDAASLEFTLQCGLAIALPVELLQSIDFSIGRARFLSECEILQSSSGQFAVAVSGARELFGARPIAYHFEDSRDSVPSIQIGGRGSATYRIPEGFQRLQGAVLMAPTERSTPCQVIIRIENKTVWEATLSEPGRSNSIDIPVESDQRLELAVEPVSASAVGNFVVWHGLRLLK